MTKSAQKRLPAPDGAAAETPSTAYEAPRVVRLGRSIGLIRGNWQISSWDLPGHWQGYISGE
jgi:hypothetical protein